MGFIKVGCALAMIVGQTAIAQSPGKFILTGSMVTNPGSGYSATLLANSKVLIAGGGAQLYDASTGTFAPAGKMTMPRIGHAAVVLPDGRVLIAGGTGPWDPSIRDAPLFDSAEIYDPQTDAFSATGRMISVERCIKAVLLGNGKVLIVGGPKDLGDPRNTAVAELYDPAAGTFSASNGTHIISAGQTYLECPTSATLLANGQVLIPWNQGAAEIYDPGTDSFRSAGEPSWGDGMTTTTTLLMNGSVLLTGGNGPFDDDTQFGIASAEIYEASKTAFERTGNMYVPRYDHTATLLPDGTVLIAGTNRSGVGVTTGLSAAEVYDPGAGNFSMTSPMLAPRYGHTATLLPDGSVLMAGGLGVPNDATAERYYPTLMIPSPTLLTVAMDSQQGAILHAGAAQVASSSDPAAAGEVLEIYCDGLKDANVIPPQVSIGGRLAEVLWFGKAPGFSTLNQVDVRVPGGVAPGPAVPVRLTYNTRPSNEVTIGIR